MAQPKAVSLPSDEEKLREELIRNKVVLDDLIANSEMLPEMMLAAARLEMEIEKLEWENRDLQTQLDEAKREEENLKHELLLQERKRVDEAVQQQIAKTGDALAKQLQEQLARDRAEAEAERARLLSELQRVREASKTESAELNEQLTLMQALAKKYKGQVTELEAQRTKEAELRQALENDLVLLRSQQPAGAPVAAGPGPVSARSLHRQASSDGGALASARSAAGGATGAGGGSSAGAGGGDDETEKDERDEVIAIHASQRLILEAKVAELNTEVRDLKKELREERAKAAALVKEFDAYKIAERARDAASAKYKLQLLKRVRIAEEERDELAQKYAEMEKKFGQLYSANVAAQEAIDEEKRRAKSELERERRRTDAEVERARKKAMEELEKEIRRAEEEVERLRKKADEEKERRQKLEAMERARQKALDERSRSRYDLLRSRSLASEAFAASAAAAAAAAAANEVEGKADGANSSGPTTAQLIDQYKMAHAKAAVQIYSTDIPDIYIFGTKKIHLIVLNGQLMVRVGGGYATIDDFVSKHAPAEARKLRNAIEKAQQRELELIQAEENKPAPIRQPSTTSLAKQQSARRLLSRRPSQAASQPVAEEDDD
jgi:chromosome segregation ATPase